MVEGQSVMVTGESITKVGDSSDIDSGSEDRVIDGTGKFLIPGMIDLHVHLSFTHSLMKNFEREMLRRKDAWWAYTALKNAQEYLKYGFTTLRGCGSSKHLASLKEAFNEGMFRGPRLKLALRTIGQLGNQELYGPQEWIDVSKTQGVSGVEGVIAAVRERKSEGSDHIKTTTTGGVLHGKESDVNRTLWREDELKAMVSETERLGMYVAAHAHTDQGIREASLAGVRSIEHGTMMSEETIDEMVKRNTYLVPTQSAGTFIDRADESVKKQLPPEVIKKWKFVSSKMVESHKIAFEKGVIIGLGTDAPVAGEHCHSPLELQLMIRNVGMTPAQALQAATINAAKVMRMEEQIGNIREGYSADFSIVNKNPLEDISVLSQEDTFEKVFIKGNSA